MKNKILIPAIGFLTLTPFVVLAKIVPCDGPDCNICHLAVGVKNVIDFLLKDIAFPLTVIAFLYGGIMLIISRGSENNLNKGKKAIWSAFWGILIAFGAWLIISLAIGNLISKDVIFWPWNAFPGC